MSCHMSGLQYHSHQHRMTLSSYHAIYSHCYVGFTKFKLLYSTFHYMVNKIAAELELLVQQVRIVVGDQETVFQFMV